MSDKNSYRYFLAGMLVIIVIKMQGCAVSPNVCIKDGKDYCSISGNFTGQWYDYYERALACMEGECYDNALQDLESALDGRFEDQRRARTMGLHFIDYFPHREKGLVHYLQGQYHEAKEELELSLQQYPSEKANFYLDEVRKKLLELGGLPLSEPDLTLTIPPEQPDKAFWTRDDPVIIAGIAADNRQYVSEIILADKPVFMESSARQTEFRENLRLDQGRHEIDIIARNLAGGEAKQRIIINVDRVGPVITLEKFVPGITIQGYAYDESGEISLLVNNIPVEVFKQKKVRFDIPLDPGTTELELLAKDKLGNETLTAISPDTWHYQSSEKMLVRNISDIAADTENIYTGNMVAGIPDAGNIIPEIRLKGWLANSSGNETVFKDTIHIQAEARTPNSIESIHINDMPILHLPGVCVSFNHFVRLTPGENTIRIQAADKLGNICTKDINIIRKIPTAFQLDHRYSLVVNPFDTLKQTPRQIKFQYWFLKNLISLNRFQIKIREELQKVFQDQGFQISRKKEPAAVQAVLLGVIYETGMGIEIAGRLVDVESRETLTTADVYENTKAPDTLAAMSERLAEKFYRNLPLTNYMITDILSDKIVVIPEKQMLTKGKVISRLPMIVYRETDPRDRHHGSDTEILCKADIESLTEKGGIAISIENIQKYEVGLKDKVISQ